MLKNIFTFLYKYLWQIKSKETCIKKDCCPNTQLYLYTSFYCIYVCKVSSKLSIHLEQYKNLLHIENITLCKGK